MFLKLKKNLKLFSHRAIKTAIFHPSGHLVRLKMNDENLLLRALTGRKGFVAVPPSRNPQKYPLNVHDVLCSINDISKHLVKFETLEKSFRDILDIAAKIVPLRSALIIDAGVGAPHVVIWPASKEKKASTSGPSVDAQAAYTYLTTMYADEVPNLRVEQILKKIRSVSPILEADDKNSGHYFIVAPLAIERHATFGVLQVECADKVDEGSIAFINALANQLSVAMDRSHTDRLYLSAKETSLRFRELVDGVDAVIWESDIGSDRFSLVNHRAKSMFGYPPEDWMAKENFLASIIVAEDQPKFLQHLKNAADGEKGAAVEYRVKCASGEIVWVLGFTHGVVRNSGPVQQLRGLIVNITESKKREAELHSAKEEAELANVAKSRFLANMSHEIRTPLGAIMGFTELLLDKNIETADKKKFGQTIRRNGKLLTGIISDILDLSKVEAGRIDIEKVPLSLPGVIAEVTATMAVQARANDVDFKVTYDEAVPEKIYSDPIRLKQILLNVIGNAIKFTHKGRVEARIVGESGSGPNGFGKVAIIVSDTGIGISPEQAHKIFHPFVQADDSYTRKYGGSGLGLVLSRRLANLLGGDVILTQSIQGKGSTFKITIESGLGLNQTTNSAVSESGEAFPVEGFPKREELSPEELKGTHILLVEDEPDSQFFLNHMLVNRGAKVDIACNGKQGVKMALTSSYDLVLMDLQMSGGDGYEAASELRRQGYPRPIVALSAHAMKEDKERAVRAGCNGHLSKPVESTSFLMAVADYVAMHH